MTSYLCGDKVFMNASCKNDKKHRYLVITKYLNATIKYRSNLVIYTMFFSRTAINGTFDLTITLSNKYYYITGSRRLFNSFLYLQINDINSILS